MTAGDARDRQRVLTMEAGPEMDAEIARVIFKRTRIGYYGPPEDGRPWAHIASVRHDTPESAEDAYRRLWESRTPQQRYGTVDPGDLCSSLCYWKEGWGPIAVDEYSTYASDALTLLETFPSYTICKRTAGEPYRVTVFYRSGCEDAYADTMPLAVCRAALLATLDAGEGRRQGARAGEEAER